MQQQDRRSLYYIDVLIVEDTRSIAPAKLNQKPVALPTSTEVDQAKMLEIQIIMLLLIPHPHRRHHPGCVHPPSISVHDKQVLE